MADYPGIVIQTSFSQKRKDLPKLAEDYILGSIGNITVVIGLDIEYWKLNVLHSQCGDRNGV